MDKEWLQLSSVLYVIVLFTTIVLLSYIYTIGKHPPEDISFPVSKSYPGLEKMLTRDYCKSMVSDRRFSLVQINDKEMNKTVRHECNSFLLDSHDMVLRFNNAPTDGFEDDVGAKTSIRVLNSQVLTKPEFNFLEDPLFKNVSLLIWDPANYSSTLEDWYNHPDFPLFPVYKKLLEERKNNDAHLLQPRVLWDLWGVLQDTSPYRLRKNPPSSGFIGVWFALHRCRRVRVFEYVPSVRATRRCHYHAPGDDAACTLGSWHPLAQEKALAERMRDNSDLDVFQIGFIDVVGFRNVTCNG